MNEESIKKIFEEMTKMLLQKNADYGSASFDLGLNGNMVHLWDKVNRYKTLVEKGTNHYESIEDTLQDIIGYAVIGLHILDTDKEKRK